MKQIFSNNATELARKFRKRGIQSFRIFMRHERNTMRYGLRQAIKMSSGHYYVLNTVKPGPYGWKSKGVPGPPEILNIQKGKLVASWGSHTRMKGDGVESVLYNTQHYAVFMNQAGTKLMIPRPIFRVLMDRIQKRRMENLQKAIQEILLIKEGG